MAKATVSVVVPVYDGEAYIAEALESVRSQHVEGLETIVVDDGSTDGSADIALRYGAHVLREPRRGVAHARNRGIAAARGELVAFLDSDDLWTENSLAPRIAYLASHPDVDFVFGHMLDFIEPTDPPPAWLRAPRTRRRVGMGCTFLARREILARTGPFDETLVIGEDLDWLARAHDCGSRSECLDGVFARRRLHAHSACARHASLGRQALQQVVRSAIDRKRGQAA